MIIKCNNALASAPLLPIPSHPNRCTIATDQTLNPCHLSRFPSKLDESTDSLGHSFTVFPVSCRYSDANPCRLGLDRSDSLRFKSLGKYPLRSVGSARSSQ